MSSSADTGVVITGLGLCSPLGPDRETTWQRLLAGDCALRWIDPDCRWAGGPVSFDAVGDSFCKVAGLAVHVADEAWRDSRLSWEQLNPNRCGSVFGTSKGELETLLTCDLANAHPPDWTNFWPSGAAVRVADRFRFGGPVLAPVAACATGLVACLRGAELIQSGLCDVVLAGSADASLFPGVIGSFRRLGVLSKIEEDPARACRPFDRRRSGFLIGEGAACLVMECRAHAARRGARWYGEWLGGRQGSDPSGLTQIDESGAPLARVLSDLLEDCQRVPDYINLHGTATKTNDIAECRAVNLAFGTAARGLACSGLKGSLGHLLGAAGSVELALTLLALRDQIVPMTLNLTHPDPDCDLDLTPGRPQRRAIETAYKISSGFGGHLAVAAVARGTGH